MTFGVCQYLGIAYFVEAIRQNLLTMELGDAIETAVNECIRKDILRDFLMEQKAEVIAMSIYEYNEEYVRKTLFEDGKETGYNQGKAVGEKKLGKLISLLLSEGKMDDVRLVCEDESAREAYYRQYNIGD